MTVFYDDKRFVHGKHLPPRQRWTYCKYCYKNVSTFILDEPGANHLMRVCWECGAGLELINRSEEDDSGTD